MDKTTRFYKVIVNGQTIMDVSDTTATPEEVLAGKTFYMYNGAFAEGTKRETVLKEKQIIQNGIYLASQEGADGFSKVVVNILTPTVEEYNGEYTIQEAD